MIAAGTTTRSCVQNSRRRLRSTRVVPRAGRVPHMHQLLHPHESPTQWSRYSPGAGEETTARGVPALSPVAEGRRGWSRPGGARRPPPCRWAACPVSWGLTRRVSSPRPLGPCPTIHAQPTENVSEAPGSRCGWQSEEAHQMLMDKGTTLVTFLLWLKATFDTRFDRRVGGTMWEEALPSKPP